MEQDTIMLAASAATTVAGSMLFMYLRNMRNRVKTHILRHEELGFVRKP